MIFVSACFSHVLTSTRDLLCSQFNQITQFSTSKAWKLYTTSLMMNASKEPRNRLVKTLNDQKFFILLFKGELGSLMLCSGQIARISLYSSNWKIKLFSWYQFKFLRRKRNYFDYTISVCLPLFVTWLKSCVCFVVLQYCKKVQMEFMKEDQTFMLVPQSENRKSSDWCFIYIFLFISFIFSN